MASSIRLYSLANSEIDVISGGNNNKNIIVMAGAAIGMLFFFAQNFVWK